MDAHLAEGTTIDLTVKASQCRALAKGGSIILKYETLEFKKVVKTTVVEFQNDGADLSDNYKNDW